VSDSDAYETGMRTRREVLGDAHVDRATASAGEFGAPFQELITRYAWGAAWSRPGIDRRMRSAITLAALVSLRAENELGMHIRAALGNGLTAQEIREVLLHTSVYAGVPAGNAAFAVAQRVLSEEGAI
jgi:4-carboxymuconolactone decarboxylase